MSDIGVNDLIPKGILTVIWSCPDDERQLHTNKFNNVPYFPESPVIILSSTALAEPVKDDKVTWVLKIILYFYLGFWEVKKENSSLRTLSSRSRDPIWIWKVF